jgi:hypothetical protein
LTIGTPTLFYLHADVAVADGVALDVALASGGATSATKFIFAQLEGKVALTLDLVRVKS